MYEALCRHLRSLAKLWGVSTPNEAADVIEELSREYESIAKSLNESVELVRKLQSPRWVSVTERLPEEGQYVLVSYMSISGAMRAVSYWFSDDRNKVRWGGEIELFVTHWMPLPPAPEPPKEEA